ncbi:lysylphosphatidylglycerol synthase transmembrane domain-containing protein [Ruminococcus sp.]|uniref:lysylphosphatidylglycerol synthase transmembrane domain-containing protein n=1 Tax=Ruminococcus sp. TaxID=41978 RepID=UPI0025EABC4A|nr:lysylphosphatidylglycerol synthase transmembrane domain-containing protein [Ruminococcus sp.]
MMKIKKNLKYVLNVLFIALIGWLTVRLLFKGEEFSDIIKDLHLAKKSWLALGTVFVFCYVAGESVIIKYMLRLFDVKTPFHRCLKYSFIGFFFSCITPSASGGQPAQMYYMKKDDIKIGFSTLIMLMITIAFKGVQVLVGVIFLLFNYSFVKVHIGRLWWLLLVGFLLNIAYIVGLVFIFFKPLWARKMGIKFINFLTRLKILKQKNNEKYINKLKRICDNYIVGAEYIKNNVHTVVNIFAITLVQRMFLLSVTWIVYRSYGLSSTGYIGIVALQTMIGIAVEMLPLPGAAGVTEGCFTYMFMDIFSKDLVKPAMLLSRGLSFYFLLFMSAAVTFVAHFMVMRKDKKNGIEAEDMKEPK